MTNTSRGGGVSNRVTKKIQSSRGGRSSTLRINSEGPRNKFESVTKRSQESTGSGNLKVIVNPSKEVKGNGTGTQSRITQSQITSSDDGFIIAKSPMKIRKFSASERVDDHKETSGISVGSRNDGTKSSEIATVQETKSNAPKIGNRRRSPRHRNAAATSEAGTSEVCGKNYAKSRRKSDETVNTDEDPLLTASNELNLGGDSDDKIEKEFKSRTSKRTRESDVTRESKRLKAGSTNNNEDEIEENVNKISKETTSKAKSKNVVESTENHFQTLRVEDGNDHLRGGESNNQIEIKANAILFEVNNVKDMVREVLEQNKELMKKFIDIEEKMSASSLAPSVCNKERQNMTPRKEYGEESNLSTKKRFEEIMDQRLPMLRSIFSDEKFKRSTGTVFTSTIIRCRVKHEVPPQNIYHLFQLLSYSVQKTAKGPVNGTEIGMEAGTIKRSIILDCVRKFYTEMENAYAEEGGYEEGQYPRWLRKVQREGSSTPQPYISEDDMEKGYLRRERIRGDDYGSKRRKQISEGKVIANFQDDGEYVGWVAYGMLTTFLTRTRKVANAMLFESVLYLFSPWRYTIDDREVANDEGDNVTSNGSVSSNVIKSITKENLRMRWVSDRKDVIRNLKDIPLSYNLSDTKEANAKNREIYLSFVAKRKELQMEVEHRVAVHRHSKGKGTRQRKGRDIRIFSRTITLMDAASQYLYGLHGGDRTGNATEFMSHNRRSPVAIYLLAVCFRDMIETTFAEKIQLPDSSISRNIHLDKYEFNDRMTSEFKGQMKNAIEKFTPNVQTQGRIFNRCIWGVSEDEFMQHHNEFLFNANARGTKSNRFNPTKACSDVERLLEDDIEFEEVEEEMSVQGRHDGGYTSEERDGTTIANARGQIYQTQKKTRGSQSDSLIESELQEDNTVYDEFEEYGKKTYDDDGEQTDESDPPLLSG